jgi:hypothetical protein
MLTKADHYEIVAIAARRTITDQLPDVDIDCWIRNRSPSPVGFHVDASGRLLAFAMVPKPGCTAAEFADTVRMVASQADRTEFRLTGKDRD